MTWYAAAVTCPGCGQEHGAGLLQVPGSPARAGTAAELWSAGELPPAMAELVRCKFWCAKAGAYLPQEDPAKVRLEPRDIPAA